MLADRMGNSLFRSIGQELCYLFLVYDAEVSIYNINSICTTFVRGQRKSKVWISCIWKALMPSCIWASWMQYIWCSYIKLQVKFFFYLYETFVFFTDFLWNILQKELKSLLSGIVAVNRWSLILLLMFAVFHIQFT